MKKEKIESVLVLFLVAAIWGFSFVAQRIGMRFMGPFLFNSVRFMLGAIVLLPFILFKNKKESEDERYLKKEKNKKVIFAGVFAGFLIFIAVSFQQFGVIYTTAGKAGFITGLYIIFVPIIGIIFKQKIKINVWIGVILAIIGLYLLSIKNGMSMGKGDIFVLIGAIFWAFHVQIIGHFAGRVESLKLAFGQFFVNSLLSFSGALIFEKISLYAISKGIWAILYAGVLSVGVAYTLQIFGQKRISPSVSAIILSIESVFSVIGGWLVLNEILSVKEIIGCLLMLLAMIIAQISFNDDNLKNRREV
jgi:drug/metabolite transporter (DMT)-like permease